MTTQGGDRGAAQELPDRPPASFREFLAWLKQSLGREVEGLDGAAPMDLFARGAAAGIPEEDMARRLGEFCAVPVLRTIDPDDADFQTLPRPFCQSKLVVPVKSVGASQTIIVSNPFDWELLDDVRRSLPRGRKLAILLAAPGAIRAILAPEEPGAADHPSRSRPPGGAPSRGTPSGRENVYDPDKDPGKTHPVAKLAVDLLFRAVSAGAGGLLLEPKKPGVVAARAVIEGDHLDLQEMPDETGRMLVARFKSLSGMDLAKKRTPQRGRMDVLLQDNVYKLRVVTSPTSSFENLSIRVLDLSRPPGSLTELGMTPDQAETILELARQEQGVILVTGPVGSGKTATLYSLLSAMETAGRTAVSVEDPVECRLGWVDQKEVHEEDGASLDALLRDAVGEEPDVLLLSEIGGLVSATACLEFAAAGHLVLTSMNTASCTTAVLRLERMGVARSAVAGAVIGLVGQRLLRRLCPECRQLRPLSPHEASLLRRFTDELPPETAHPAGCSACRGSGYRGREAVFEVIRVDAEMAEAMSAGKALGDCSDLLRKRGIRLLGDQAVQRVRDLAFPVEDVYREVLLEDLSPLSEETLGREDGGGHPAATPPGRAGVKGIPSPGGIEGASILVVDDDGDTRALLDRILSVAGFRVIQASDGGEALLKLGRESIDLILSDIHMPSLDGLKLLEIVHQHRIAAPVLLLTAEPSPDVEARCLEMGAVDYLRKPMERSVLLARIRKALGESTDGVAPGGSPA